MKKSLLILFCIAVSINKVHSQTNWELLNPKPTANTGKDVEFVTSNIGFIITSNELLETTDAGNNWLKKQNISSGNDMSIYNSTGYIVGNNGYVLKSTDNGASWNQISTGFNSSFNTVNIIDHNNIVLSSSNSIVKTDDGGFTWESISIPISGVNINKTSFTNSLVGHAVCNNGIILKTIDGGLNWYITKDDSNITPSDYFTVYFINDSTGFATREHYDIYKTTDAGETWVEISIPGQAIFDFHFLDENNGFATGDHGATFKTNNGGTTWEYIFFQDGLFGGTSMYGIYFQDNNVGYATGQRGRIVKTTDGGNTWTPHSISYIDFRQIQFVDNNVGYAQSRENFYKTIDAGVTWFLIGSLSLGTSVYSSDFTFVNENLGYATTGGPYGGHVFKTIDGGATWSALNNGFDIIDEGITAIYFLDEDKGFISGGFNQKKVMKTIDGGNNWTQVSNQVFGHIQFANDLIGYGNRIGNYYAAMYKTIDGGDTWNISLELEGENIIAFDFVDENNGYFVGDQGLIYKTNNGGSNWEELEIPYEWYTQVKFYTEDIGFIADEDGKLYKTEDGGINWHFLTQQYKINSIDLISNYIFTAGTKGKIYRGETGVLNIENFAQDQKVLIYPNPATNFVNVFKSNISEKVSSIELYNSLGQRIYYENATNKNDIKIDLSNFRRGIYFVKIRFENTKIVSSKLILK